MGGAAAAPAGEWRKPSWRAQLLPSWWLTGKPMGDSRQASSGPGASCRSCVVPMVAPRALRSQPPLSGRVGA